MSTHSKELDELIRHSTAQGWRHSRTNGSHHQFYGPDKHTIVVFSGTPSDGRGWQNSLSQMKRAGYMPPNEGYQSPTLADTLKPTHKAEVESVEPTQHTTGRGELRRAVTEYFRRHLDEVVTMDVLTAVVQKEVPTTNQNSVANCCTIMRQQGLLSKISRGAYMMKNKEKNVVATATVAPDTASPPPPDTSPVPAATAPTKIDDSLAADIAALDTALAALGEIEGVVRRTQEKINQLIALRKALGG